ncbi:MAG TPA: protein kinase [Kofleriaceae bacterium]
MTDTHGRQVATLTSVTPWDGESRAGTDLAPGTRIKQYELIRELGRGGMGVVYVARDLVLGRRVAIKFLRAVDQEVLDRFLVEARATAQASHENIVIIFETDVYESMPYMVLEYIEGKTLREFMGPWGEGVALPASRVVELMLPVARALARAHEHNIVHRDLKPENIMVTDAGQVKVLDFGIAKALGQQEIDRSHSQVINAARSLTLTREGNLVGTLPYMSPEQLGQDVVDHRSDLFSLGQIMFEMLAGRHAVEPLSADTLVQNLIDDAPMRSLRVAVPTAPAPLADVVDACLVKTKAARMPSAAELADRLESLLPHRRGRALAEGESPYPGLTAFQETDANRFFGRSRDVARMVSRVRELPLTCVVGPSGVGKSSFIRAGVTPALKASGEAWDVITIRPGRYPLSTLANVIERLTLTPTPVQSASYTEDREHGQLIGQLRAAPGLLGAKLRERAAASRSHIVVFVDQLEELYTLVTDADERRAFTAALSAVADDPAAPLRVIVSMRSDFLDRAGEDQHFLDGLSRGLVFLSPPDRDGLREALELPVEMVGYRFETSAMVGDMLDSLASTPGALPLLQFAAAKLWDARDRHQRLLTAASYTAIGGISGALATHADEVVRNMSTAAQKLTQRIFRQLVTPERTRAIVEIADLFGLSPDREEIQRVLDQLVAARLLVVQTRTDAAGSVEIVHESLIDRWPTLRRWLDEAQEDAGFLAQLAAASKQWEAKGRATGLLWRGEAHDEARRWVTAKPRELTARDQAFIDEVIALGRRGTRARRIGVVAAFIVLGAIAAGASIGFLQVRAARDEARLANDQAEENATKAEENARQAVENAKKAEDQLAKTNSAIDAKKVAEQSADDAISKKNAAEKQLEELMQLTKEQLAEKYKVLQQKSETTEAARTQADALRAQAEAARAQADAARAQADAEKKKAMALKVEADSQRDRAEKALAAETARREELARQLKTLSTKLKD